MADNDTSTDQTDEFLEGEFEDDGTAQIIRDILDEEDDTDAPDDGGFDQPFEAEKEQVNETVGVEEGRLLIDKADRDKDTLNAKSKVEVKGEPHAEDTKDAKADETEAKESSEEQTPASEDAGKQEDGEDKSDEGEKGGSLEEASIDSLLDGVADDHRAEINRRLSSASDAMKPFENPYIKDQMKAFGATPVEVATRLVDLAAFANEKPSEYIAWAAKDIAGGDAEQVKKLLNEAAEFHGLTVVAKEQANSEDDDLFDDPEKADMRRQIAELQGKLDGKSQGDREFGPDTQARTQARDFAAQMEAFRTETDENGDLKRPLYATLLPAIAQRASEQKAATGVNVTIKDLGKIYEDIVSEIGATTTPADPASSAAQSEDAVKEKEADKKAAAAEKAMNASKSVDGTGQGAPRRPALSPDAPLEEVIAHHMSDGS